MLIPDIIIYFCADVNYIFPPEYSGILYVIIQWNIIWVAVNNGIN